MLDLIKEIPSIEKYQNSYTYFYMILYFILVIKYFICKYLIVTNNKPDKVICK